MYLRFECVDREYASRVLANRIASLLDNAVTLRGRASLVVSGGTSPTRMFECLREHALPWQHITVVASDERVVDIDHVERNEAMIRRDLLQGPAAAATLISLVSDTTNLDQAEHDGNQQLASLQDAFDVVVLGMGEDGHTASLFPDAPNLQMALESDKHCIVQEVPRLSHPRMSMTPTALLNSRHVFLLCFGEGKYSVLRDAEETGEVGELPVRCVLHQQSVPVSTYWAP